MTQAEALQVLGLRAMPRNRVHLCDCPARDLKPRDWTWQPARAYRVLFDSFARPRKTPKATEADSPVLHSVPLGNGLRNPNREGNRSHSVPKLGVYRPGRHGAAAKQA